MAVNWFDYQPRVAPLYGGPQFESGNPVSAARQSETVQYAPKKQQGQGVDPLTTAIGLGAITKAVQDKGAEEAAEAAGSELWNEALQGGLGDQITQASGWFGSAAPEVAAEEVAAEAAGEGLAEAGLGSALSGWGVPLGLGALGGLLFSRWF